jgi:hypothetical protein
MSLIGVLVVASDRLADEGKNSQNLLIPRLKIVLAKASRWGLENLWDESRLCHKSKESRYIVQAKFSVTLVVKNNPDLGQAFMGLLSTLVAT